MQNARREGNGVGWGGWGVAGAFEEGTSDESITS